MKKILSILLMVCLIILSAGCGVKQNNTPKPNEPTKPEVKFPERALEFVACASPGGGHDTLMRTIAKIASEKGFITTPITVVNKPGGASATGMAYVNGHAGDGHYLMAATSQYLATPLNTNSDINYEDFTAIALVAIDPDLVLVHTDSPYKSIQDVIKSGKTINVGGTGKGSIEHLTVEQMIQYMGAKLNYVPFQADGEVAAALLGKQVDMVVVNPSSAIDYVTSGKFRPLVITTEKRMAQLPDVPTFKELGYDITMAVFRGVAAPKGIPAEAKQYYIDAIKKVVESEEWKKTYLEPNLMAPAFLAGDDFDKYLVDMNKTYKDILTKLGIIK